MVRDGAAGTEDLCGRKTPVNHQRLTKNIYISSPLYMLPRKTLLLKLQHEKFSLKHNKHKHNINIIFMRPSSIGGGRILRRTLSVCPSVRLSVRPSRSGASLGAT